MTGIDDGHFTDESGTDLAVCVITEVIAVKHMPVVIAVNIGPCHNRLGTEIIGRTVFARLGTNHAGQIALY